MPSSIRIGSLGKLTMGLTAFDILKIQILGDKNLYRCALVNMNDRRDVYCVIERNLSGAVQRVCGVLKRHGVIRLCSCLLDLAGNGAVNQAQQYRSAEAFKAPEQYDDELTDRDAALVGVHQREYDALKKALLELTK